MEQYVNNFETTLADDIDSSQTSIEIASATGLPTSGNFRLLMGTELVLCTAISGTTLTVQRGIEGTTQAAHSSGATVTALLTRDALEAIRSDLFLSGPYSSLPAASTAGRLYFPTDSPILLYDNGASWDAYGPISRIKPPPSSLLSTMNWQNQGSAVANWDQDGIDFYCPADATSHPNYRVLTTAAPSPPWKLTTAWSAIIDIGSSTTTYFGVAVREGSGGSNPDRIAVFQEGYNSSGVVVPGYQRKFQAFASPTLTNPGAYSNEEGFSALGGPLTWLRIEDDGVDLIVSLSRDGLNWLTYDSVSRTAYTTPNELGVAFLAVNGDVLARLVHWEVS